jgi:hypothetical protein
MVRPKQEPKQEGWQGKRREFTEDQGANRAGRDWTGKIDLHRARELVQTQQEHAAEYFQ